MNSILGLKERKKERKNKTKQKNRGAKKSKHDAVKWGEKKKLKQKILLLLGLELQELAIPRVNI